MRSVALGVVCTALSLFCLGCAKPRAGGDPREVAVLADEAVWAVVGSTFTAGLERKVVLLDEETVFWVHGFGLEEMQTVRRRPLVVFLAAVDHPGPVGDIVSALAGKALDSLAASSPFTRMTDPWAHGQVAYLLVERTTSRLDSLAARVVGRLYSDFFDRYRTTVRDRLYARGEDRARTKEILARYGWSLGVPRPWQMEEEPDEHWVHFVKTEPDRHVSVYWEDWPDTTVAPEYCFRTRRALAWRHYDEDEIDEARTSYSWGTFLGRPSLEISGAWENWKYEAGGPFRTICFVVKEQQRLYFIDLVTFAPDRPKFYVMTQLGIIAETFKVTGRGAGGLEPS